MTFGPGDGEWLRQVIQSELAPLIERIDALERKRRVRRYNDDDQPDDAIDPDLVLAWEQREMARVTAMIATDPADRCSYPAPADAPAEIKGRTCMLKASACVGHHLFGDPA